MHCWDTMTLIWWEIMRMKFCSNQSLSAALIEFETLIHWHSKNHEEQVEKALHNKEECWKELESGLITFCECIYIPIHAKLWEDIVCEIHNSTFAGHPSCYKTAELITHNYWWPQVQHNIWEYIEGCETCQWVKTHCTLPAALLHPHEALSWPWEIIMLDLLGLLPMSNGYNTILIIVDQFTKYVKFEATHVELTAEGFMKVLWDQVFCDHGLPWKIIHNCDTQFVNKYIKALFNLLSIK